MNKLNGLFNSYRNKMMFRRFLNIVPSLLVLSVIFVACQKDNKSAKDYFESGLSNIKSGNPYSAKRDFNKAIELKPDYAEAYFNRRGENLDDSSALLDLNKAIYFKSDYLDAYIERGSIKRNLFDFEGSFSDYKKALELKPDCAEVYLLMGITKESSTQYMITNDFNVSRKGLYESINYINKAIELDPNYISAYYNRGRFKSLLTDYLGAISDYTKAIKLDPNSYYAFYERGNAKYLYGEGTEYYIKYKNDACLDWYRAKDLGSSKAQEMINNYCK